MYLAERPRRAPVAGDAAARSGEEAGGGAARRVPGAVVAIGAVSLLTDISSEAVAAVLPLYATVVLGLSPLSYGLLDGIYQGVSGLVRVLAGWVSDRSDRPKWVAFAGYALSAVTKPLLLLGGGFAALTAIVAVDRLGKGVRTGPRDAVIAASSHPSAWGRAFGVHRAMDTLGAAIGPLLAFVVLWAVPGGFSSVFVVSAAAAFMGLVVLVLLVPDVRPRREATAHGAEPARPSLRALGAPGMRRIAAVTGLLGVLTVSDGFLYLSLLERDDLAAAWFPLLFVGTNVAYAVLAVPFGRLSDRVGRQRVLVGGHLLLALAYFAAAGPGGGPAATLLVLALLGAFYAATDGVLSALTAAALPASSRAVGIATAQTVVSLSRFVAALAFGAVWTVTGRSGAVLVFGMTLALAVPVAWWLLRGVGRTGGGGAG